MLQLTLDQRFQRAFKAKQPSAGRASEASEGGGTSGHPGPFPRSGACQTACQIALSRQAWRPNLITKMSHALLGINLAVKTSETVALFFLDFLSLRTDFFLAKIAPHHISVLKFLFVKAAVFGPEVCFTLAT